MAKIKFVLKMPDGAEIRTLEQLREHFDLRAILSYYSSGRLYDWLDSRGYDEAEKLKALNPSSESFQRDLYEVLGVPHPEMENPDLSLSDIAARNGRLERLKQFTADDIVLAAVDRVAFTQEELDALLDRTGCTTRTSMSYGISKSSIGGFTTQTSSLTVPARDVIYLCGDRFVIPGNIGEVTYIGINDPLIRFDGNISASGIDIDGVDFDFNGYAGGGDIIEQFNKTFKQNPELGAKLLQKSAGRGSVSAQIILGDCYSKGFGVEPSAEETVKWYRKAAEQGNAEAQNSLGTKYWKGEGIGQNYEYAYRWFLRSAKQGYAIAQYNLGICYGHGKGVEKDEEEAIKWLREALDQGYERAKSELMELMPKLFKLSDVIKYAIGGAENLGVLSTFEKESGEIRIYVLDRNMVNETVLRNFGASSVSIEPEYRFDIRERPMIEKVARNVGRAAIHYVLGDPLAAYKVIANDDPEFIQKDTGCGWVHIQMKLDQDMEDDLRRRILYEPDPNTSFDFGDLSDIFGSFFKGDDSKEGDT